MVTKSGRPTTTSKMMSIIIIMVLLFIHIHEILPDYRTSIHRQEEPTENRDKTNEQE